MNNNFTELTEKEIQSTFILRCLGLKAEKFQPNERFNDPIASKDCTTRTICKLTGLTWDEVFWMQFRIAKPMGTQLNYIKVIEKILKNYGFVRANDIISINKIEMAEFMYNNKSGSFAIASNGHIIPYIDGTIYDSHFKSFDKFIINKNYCVFCKEEIIEDIKNQLKTNNIF